MSTTFFGPCKVFENGGMQRLF